MLVVCAIVVSTKQYVGDPIQCWCPAYFKGTYDDYANKVNAIFHLINNFHVIWGIVLYICMDIYTCNTTKSVNMLSVKVSPLAQGV